MKEIHGDGDAIIGKIMEKETFKFYKHPTGFSLYKYDADIEKEVPLFTEQGSPSWHFKNPEMNGENHEGIEPTGKFWHCIHLVSTMALSDNQEQKEAAQEEIQELEEELEYHEKKIVRAVWGSIQKHGAEIIGQEEIFKLLYAGELEV